jgi:hypothetical protein
MTLTGGESAARPMTVISRCVADSASAELRMRYFAAGSSPIRPLSHAIGYFVKGKTQEALSMASFTSPAFNPVRKRDAECLKKNNKKKNRVKNDDDDQEDGDGSRENQHVLRRFLVAARIYTSL